MANILVSGLINMETTVRVRQFPVNYYPIDYPFFGVNTAAVLSYKRDSMNSSYLQTL